MCESDSSWFVNEEEEEQVLQVLKEIHGEDIPAAHGGPLWNRYPPAAHGGPSAGGDGCQEEAGTPWEAHAGAELWQWHCGQRSLPWVRFAARICDPARDLHWSSLLLKNCSLQKGPALD